MTARTCSTRSTRSSPRTSATTSATPSLPIPSTSRPTPIPRATAPSAPRIRTPTSCCTSPARPTTGSSSAAPSSRPPRPTPTRRSSSRRSATGASQELSDYAVGFIADMGAPGIRHICRSSFAQRGAVEDYPLSGRFDEIDTMIVFDDVEIPWENVLFYRHTRAAAFIRATLHRYSMFAFVQRHLRFADLLVGVAALNANQTGVKAHQGVREKLAELACLPRGHPRAPDRGDRARRAQPGRAADAQPGAALHRPRARLHPAAGDDAPRPRPVRRPALRHPERGHVPGPRGRAVAGQVPRASATSAPSSGGGCSRSPATCSTPTTPGTGSPSSCSRSPRRSPTCWPSTTTTTSRARSTSCAATPASTPRRRRGGAGAARVTSSAAAS